MRRVDGLLLSLIDGDIGTDKIYYVSQIKNACDEYRVLLPVPVYLSLLNGVPGKVI